MVEMRPPALCEGCGLRDMYTVLTQVLKEEYPTYKVFSDIGCYTLGANAPFNAINSCVNMGASITMAKGASDAGLHPAVAVIGDSTFTHSGMTGLLDCVNENADVTIVISDNETTAMTGGQDSAGTGRLEAICAGIGVAPEHIRVVVPLKKNYEEMKQQNMLVKSNSGVDVQMIFHGNNAFMDATNPKTRRYVWEKCKQNYADLGIRTFWLDVAEPEYTSYDFENYRYYSGTVLETGNIYPREYARLFYEGQKENGQDDIVNLIRCAWAGSQRYGALVWSGDIMSTYEDFRKQICAGIHMGLSGIPWWTTDIGGFHGGVTEDPDFQELLVRWFQFGTFCPVMRIHGNRGPREEIINKAGEVREGTGADNEVWSFGEKNYEILTKFIGVREKMRDYTRSLMAEAHEKGTPVMRTMFYEFPEDAACWDISDAYMFGSDILVAPIVRPKATSRTVYLPAGASWTLANTGDVYEGGKAYEIEAPIETLPIFLRNGKQGYLVGEI